ncbi:hypothetical protein ACFPVT_03555 [Corynebacterium choanae]|uniref:Uncharacterized protein n=1 Tax=Corynebacterium choanae TaxID=1862358 RepID=A0A3G6J949_9CORY|nr:hypothetical protein [Corynebacterium choanae]AZA14641.1 hypothetical protein CCHOA_11350 [Corynebacterium choanae]
MDEHSSYTPSGSINPWTMPTTGMQWCDCGADCELEREEVAAMFTDLGFDDGNLVPVDVVAAIIQHIWDYESVCVFFVDHLRRSLKAIHGSMETMVLFAEAVDIVGYFTKTWQGCPELDECTDTINFLRIFD